MRVELFSPFKNYQVVPSDIYWVKGQDVQYVQVSKMWLRNIAALVIFALAVITYTNASIWKNKGLRKYLVVLGDLYLMIALWLIAELNLLNILFKNTVVSAVLAMIFIRVVPVIYYQMCCALQGRNIWWLNLAGGLMWFNLVGSLLAQFVFGVSLVKQMPYHTALVTLASVICIGGMLYQFIKGTYVRIGSHLYFSSVILVIAAIGEANGYMAGNGFGEYSGIPVSIASLLYTLLAHVFLVHKESETDVKKNELEKYQTELQRKPLMQQINAHFLGNTLNTISAYCKEDPEKADEAVQLLASYLREYMHVINEGEYMGLEEELYLVELYMKIQNMRFDNRIKLEVESDFERFSLPPLCLQPLVENAVRHGIFKVSYEGIIQIKTRKCGDMAEVIIQDNGVGFQPDKKETYLGVSLTNIKTRILEMGGTMEIQSKVGKGTKVILYVPIEKESDMDEGYML